MATRGGRTSRRTREAEEQAARAATDLCAGCSARPAVLVSEFDEYGTPYFPGIYVCFHCLQQLGRLDGTPELYKFMRQLKAETDRRYDALVRAVGLA